MGKINQNELNDYLSNKYSDENNFQPIRHKRRKFKEDSDKKPKKKNWKDEQFHNS